MIAVQVHILQKIVHNNKLQESKCLSPTLQYYKFNIKAETHHKHDITRSFQITFSARQKIHQTKVQR
jgi:hypothetical protein